MDSENSLARQDAERVKDEAALLIDDMAQAEDEGAEPGLVRDWRRRIRALTEDLTRQREEEYRQVQRLSVEILRLEAEKAAAEQALKEARDEIKAMQRGAQIAAAHNEIANMRILDLEAERKAEA